MSVEFIDVNVVVYAHDGGVRRKHDLPVVLFEEFV
jgi:hypothetical protein